MRNDLYDLDQELRDLIERKFEEATGGATDVARGVTRARRRIARNAVAATLVIALFGYGAIAGFRALPRSSGVKPAVTNPGPSPTAPGEAAVPPGSRRSVEDTVPRSNGIQTDYYPQGIAAADGSIWAVSGGNLPFPPVEPFTQELGDCPSPPQLGHKEPYPAPTEPCIPPNSQEHPPAELYRIDPQRNEVSARFEVGPEGIVDLVAALDALWVLRPAEDAIVRVDPKGNRAVGRVDVPEPIGAVGLDGWLWVVTRSSGALSKIDPRTNEVTSTIPTGVVGAEGIASAGGRLWLRASSRIVGVDPSTGRIVASVALEGLSAFAGQGDELWAIACAPAAALPCEWGALRIDTTSGRVTTRLAIGRKLARLSETRASITDAMINVQANSVWVAAAYEFAAPGSSESSDGSYNSGFYGGARLLQIDPSRGTIVATTSSFLVGGLIAPPLIADGSAWLIDTDRSEVVRVDLSS